MNGILQLAAVRSRGGNFKQNDINFNNKESLDDDDDVNNIDLIENENWRMKSEEKNVNKKI